MSDRIKLKELALAMGVEPYSFNPYENANDDYAVLEWMRNTWSKDKQNDWLLANLKLGKDDFLRYQIGDYARAALKVLE